MKLAWSGPRAEVCTAPAVARRVAQRASDSGGHARGRMPVRRSLRSCATRRATAAMALPHAAAAARLRVMSTSAGAGAASAAGAGAPAPLLAGAAGAAVGEREWTRADVRRALNERYLLMRHVQKTGTRRLVVACGCFLGAWRRARRAWRAAAAATPRGATRERCRSLPCRAPARAPSLPCAAYKFVKAKVLGTSAAAPLTRD